MRGLRNPRDVGGIEILVAGGRHWSSKMGTRFAVAQGDKGGGREGQRMQIPVEAACPPLRCTWKIMCL